MCALNSEFKIKFDYSMQSSFTPEINKTRVFDILVVEFLCPSSIE